MNVPLQKWYKRIIPFLLIFCLLCNQLTASPDCPIVAANFSGLSEGTTVNNSSTGWYLNATNVSSSAIFWVKSNRFHAQELGGEGIWYSKVFSVSGYTDFQIATKITAEGDMNSSEYVKVFYKINGGAEILLDQRTGNFGTVDFVSPLLNGNNVQFVIRIYNYNNGGSQTSKYYIEDYRVFKEHGPCAGGGITVSASAGNGGVLTCANASLTLSASFAASGVSYSWTGPNNFTSTTQNPVVTVAGTYNVVATNTSGSGSASVTVTENKTAPAVTATGGALGCAANVTLNVTSSISNSLYTWTGPGSFSSTVQNPVVSTAGTYTVVVTNPANSCTTSKQVQVTAGSTSPTDFWLEDFTAANGTIADTGLTPWTIENAAAGTFSVQNNEFMASFNAANEGVWRSGIVNIGAKSNVVISVNLKSGTAGSSDYLEDDDYIRVYYKLNGGAETLLFGDIAGLNGINNGTATLTATSAALNGSTLQIVIRLRNSNSTERYYVDNVKLTGTNAGVTPLTATATGAVTCTANAQLTATPANPVSSWSWTGPNNFTSTQQNPVVSAGGQYIVTANFADGCTASVPVTVTENKTVPDVTANGGSLACFTSININASSSLSTAQYSWTGPNGFTSSLKNPAVTAAGTYTVTVTNPVNGCTAAQSVQVTPAYGTAASIWTEDFTAANGTASDNGTTAWSVQAPSGAVASVNSNQFRISNTGGTGQVVWTSGSINITGKTNVTIAAGVRSAVTGGAVMNETGDLTDYIRFYYKIGTNAEVLFCEKKGGINSHSTTLTSISKNGLSGSSLQVIVRARATGNDEFYYVDNVIVTAADQSNLSALAVANGSITCNNNTVALAGSASATGVSYSWTGPGGFSSALQNPVASVAGIYTLTVTHPSTGCTASDTALVSGSQAVPAGIAINRISETDTLTCTVNHVDLVASSSTPGATYSWNGPDGYIASSPGITAFRAGLYTVTVTNPVSGCTATATRTVYENRVFPGADVDPNLAMLTCYTPAITITGSATATTVKYSWTGPGGITATGAQITATVPGNYYLLVTDTVNGCTTSTTTVIMENKEAPANVVVTAVPASAELTCTVTNVTLTGSSSSPNVSYSWSGPSGFTAAVANPSVTLPGTYNVIVTNNANGCTVQAHTTVTRNNTPPAGVSAFSSDKLTCFTTAVNISGTSGTPGAVFSWTGPNGFTASTQNASVTAAGTYQLKVTNPANGCFGTAVATVIQNNTPPNITVSNTGPLYCSVFEVEIQGSSTTADVDYSWSGPDGFSSNAATEFVFTPGDYVLTVLDLNNGCSASDTTKVEFDPTSCDGARSSGAKTATVQSDAAKQSGKTDKAVSFEYRAYPNPFSNTAYVEFKTPQTVFVNVSIYNTLGACKKVLFNTLAQPGQLYKLPLDATTLPAGVYYCVIRVNEKLYTIKMLSLRK